VNTSIADKTQTAAAAPLPAAFTRSHVEPHRSLARGRAAVAAPTFVPQIIAVN
jgi:hypothetical protein